MTAGIHLLVLPLLCRDLVLTVEPGKTLQCCYLHKNLLRSKTIIISTLGEDLEFRGDLLRRRYEFCIGSKHALAIFCWVLCVFVFF